MELDNILKDIDEEDINPMFYSFTSQLGDIFINNKGENELSFKDNFINIQLKDLKFNNYGITLVLIKRGRDSFLPKADIKFQIGDELMVVGKIADVTKFFGLLNEDNPTIISKRINKRSFKIK